MDGRRVYRLYWLWRVALTGAGALMVYGAFELVRFVVVFHGDARGGLTVATLLGIGSLYAVWYAGVYRVILAADTITVVRPNPDFLNPHREGRSTRICLYHAEIGIVRLPNAVSPRVLAFIPRTEGAEAAYVSVRRLHTDDYFKQWCDSLPNLDSEDEHVRKYLEADNREYIPKDDPKSTPESVRVSGWIVLLGVFVLASVLVWKRLRVEAPKDSAGLVVVWFAYVAITWVTAWAVTKCLRTGIVANKWFGTQASRRENPVIFWISLTPAILVLVLELCIGAFVAYLFLNP